MRRRDRRGTTNNERAYMDYERVMRAQDPRVKDKEKEENQKCLVRRRRTSGKRFGTWFVSV